jgi:hypothetical protein
LRPKDEIDRLGGFPVSDSIAGSLTIWFEEREAQTARSLRMPLESSDLGASNETSADCVFSENSHVVIRSTDRMDDGVTSSMRDQCRFKISIQPESLILAQNERWRQA